MKNTDLTDLKIQNKDMTKMNKIKMNRGNLGLNIFGILQNRYYSQVCLYLMHVELF